jgi:hypothetical protein
MSFLFNQTFFVNLRCIEHKLLDFQQRVSDSLKTIEPGQPECKAQILTGCLSDCFRRIARHLFNNSRQPFPPNMIWVEIGTKSRQGLDAGNQGTNIIFHACNFNSFLTSFDKWIAPMMLQSALIYLNIWLWNWWVINLTRKVPMHRSLVNCMSRFGHGQNWLDSYLDMTGHKVIGQLFARGVNITKTVDIPGD